MAGLSMGTAASANTSLGARTANAPSLNNVGDALWYDSGTHKLMDTNTRTGVATEAPRAYAPSPVQYVDPYAAWGGTAAYNNLVNGFNDQKGNIYSSANDAAANQGIGLRNSILDFIDSMRSGQTAIDNKGINNELAKQRGTADVYGGISRGIQSAGVTLANRNASDSSAGEAIARAYGQQGQRQLSSIGNQYEMGNRDIALAQTDLETQRASGLRHIQGSEDQAVNTIVDDANNKLAALDAAMANANLPDRIALDTEKNKIRSQVLAKLSQYDNNLGDVNKIQAMDANGRMSEATRLASLGQAPTSAFNYTAEVPTALQGTGPLPSELPIFTYKPRRV